MPVLAKVGYSSGLGIDQMLAWRFLLAGGLASLALIFVRQPWFGVGPVRLLTLWAMGVVGYGVQTLLFYTALETLPASLTELILFTYPAFVVLGARWFYGRRIGRRKLMLLLLSVAGASLLLGGVSLKGGGFALLLAAVQPIGLTAYLLLAERLMRDTPMVTAGSMMILGAASFWTTVALIRGDMVPAPNPIAWAVIAGMVIGPSLIAIPLNLFCIGKLGSDRVALLGVSEPAVTVVLAAAVLHEALGPFQLLGGTLVLCTVVAINWPQGIRSAPPPAPFP
jgi:drug/metabolite transporter (DMT)-like permease